MCAGLVSACNNDDPVTATPKVEIKEGTPSETALTFTITPADAQAVAYVVAKKGEPVPEAAGILQTGTEGRADAAREYTVAGLEAETVYVIAAAAVNGNVYSAVVTAEMTTLAASAPERPAVELEAGEATVSALTFTIIPTYAKEVAYVVVKKGESIPEAAAILETGAKGRPDAAEEYTADGLEAETAYVIAAAAVSGEVYSDVAVVEMTTVGIPAVTVTAGKVSPSSLSFTVAPSAGVEKAAYVCVEHGRPMPSTAQELFENGTPIEDMTSPVEVEGLEVETTYVIGVAVAAAGDYSDVQTIEMTTGYDEVIKATRISVAAYFGDDAHPGKQTGQFVLGLDNIPWDAQGYASGAGVKHRFCFYSDIAASPFVAMPADGAYELDISDSGDKWTIGNNDYTWWAETDETGRQSGGGSYAEAQMLLTRSGDTYDVVMTGTTDLGATFKITYTGLVTFKNLSSGNRNLDATCAETVYYGLTASNPDTDKWTVVLHDKEQNPQASLYLEFYSTVSADMLNPFIPNGTYAANDGTTTTAGTFIPGGNGGTRLTVMENGVLKTYYCTGGEFTVARLGDNYTVACNFTTSEETTVTATFAGILDIRNKIECLNISPDRLYEGTGYYLKGGNAGVHNYYFRLADCELDWHPNPVNGGTGNLLLIDLYSDVEPDLDNILIPEGTYTLSKDYASGACSQRWTFVWHWIESGAMYSIRLVSGTVKVSRTGTVYTVEFDAVGDSNAAENFRLTARYTGEIPMHNGWNMDGGTSAKMLYSESAAYPVKPSRSALSGRSLGPQPTAGDSERMRFDRLVR